MAISTVTRNCGAAYEIDEIVGDPILVASIFNEKFFTVNIAQI
jgi:hypothetical protein